MVDKDPKPASMEEAGGGGEGSSGAETSSSSGGCMSNSQFATAQVLLKKGKCHAAKYLRDECLRNLPPQDLQPSHPQVSSFGVLGSWRSLETDVLYCL